MFLDNELDFIGVNGQTIYKTLILRTGESLNDLLSSDSKRLEIFNSNFTINVNHKDLIEEEINFKHNNIFQRVENIDLLHEFMIYLISNEKHFFLNEIIRKKIQINGEEK